MGIMRLSRVLSFVCLSLVSVTRAGTVAFDWNVTWVWANPDGLFGRPVIGINNKWPCPTIEATKGDTVVVNLNNQLGNQTTGLHFHGITQTGTPEMDGPSSVNQCPLPPGSSIKYQFTVDAPGTYWWHSHNMGQYPDGLRGPLIVHDPDDPYKDDYDEEYIMTVSDCTTAIQDMLVPTNTVFKPPIPDSLIVNEGQGLHINVTTGKTYRIRMINFAAFGSAMIHFNSHTMEIISADAINIKKKDAYHLRLAPAQRYDVLIGIDDRDNGNYPILVSLDLNRDWTNSTQKLAWNHNYTGYLVMDASQPLDLLDVVDKWNPVDDFRSLQPYDGASALGQYDRLILLDFKFCLDQNGYPRSCFNNITYINQQVPTLYSAATTGDQNTNPVVYGQVNPFIVNFNETVQLVMNNFDVANHPFHLHGHRFQILDRPDSGTGPWPGRDTNYASTPILRDTVTVMPKSYTVLRFKADNPGVWLFHCHIEWHVEMGLTATIIEAPDRLRNMTFPADHIDACKKMGIPYQGNAAGNTKNVTDTSGYATVPPTTYYGAEYTSAPSPVRRFVGPRLTKGIGRWF
ncbi:multicopper oxidase [Achaetomium macrosporum]|uniref:Multicopper oxidase n=1 Tax=Achaetomium macrosporum TaxID=79813 RepID=A0AAN7H928_9PEZI|nr:multicopper oxidase [Achaetomium macrosporum]